MYNLKHKYFQGLYVISQRRWLSSLETQDRKIIKNIQDILASVCICILRKTFLAYVDTALQSPPKLLCTIKVLDHIIHYIKDFVIHDNIDNLIVTFIQCWPTLTHKWVSLAHSTCLHISVFHFSFHTNAYIYMVR